MNREILFRGKRLDNGEWVEGGIVQFEFATFITQYKKGAYSYLDEIIVDPSTIGQYTCLNDKNGKKIFEGDILSISNKMDGIGTYYFPPIKYPYNVEVKWDMCAWMWKTLGKYEYYITFPGAWCHYECEIIGNIHDNPELLEDG